MGRLALLGQADRCGIRTGSWQRSPVVIYNGERRWTAATDVADLLGQVPGEPLGYRPRFRYLPVEIRAQDPASLPGDNVLAMIASFEQAPTADSLEPLIVALSDWLAAVGEPELDAAFWEWIERVLTLRHGPKGEKLRRTLRRRREEEGTMTLIERARKWGEERDQLWLRKGIEKGIERERQASIRRERELVFRHGQSQVRARCRRPAPADAGEDFHPGRHRRRRRRGGRMRDRRGAPPAGAGALISATA